jgi:exopolyphosphatase/guanosine-5'-triphosphate,3'-diphosphate pyrophosphatase
MAERNRSTKDLVSYNMNACSPNVAAVDLGTNSCRLLIASVDIPSLYKNYFKRGGSSDQPTRIIDSFARVVGLGEGIKQTGLLSKGAIDRTLDTLEICRDKINFYNVSRVKAVATEACRQARNAAVLIEKARALTGIALEIVTPQEEAQLVLKGCMGVMSENDPYGILVDIGGGSTEIIWLRISKNKNVSRGGFTVVDSMSLPYGVVTLRDTYVHNDYEAQTYDLAQQSISQSVSFFL